MYDAGIKAKDLKETIKRIYNVTAEDIEQEQARNLFVVTIKGKRYLISYTTIIGVELTKWYFTTERYSSTTSRQLASFKKGLARHEYIDVSPVEFQTLASPAT